jgi:hypothetical protein
MSRNRTNLVNTDASDELDNQFVSDEGAVTGETDNTVESPDQGESTESDAPGETDNESILDFPVVSGEKTQTLASVALGAIPAIFAECTTQKNRNKVKKYVESVRDASIRACATDPANMAEHSHRANAAIDLLPTLRVTRDNEGEKVDPADVLHVRIGTLLRSAALIANGNNVPDGLDVAEVDYTRFASVQSVLSELIGSFGLPDSYDESDVTASAVKLASSKLTRSSQTNDIGEFVRKAFIVPETGEVAAKGTTMLLSEISNKSAVYEEGKLVYKPSPGAIAARWLTGTKSGVPGFTFTPASPGVKASVTYVGE